MSQNPQPDSTKIPVKKEKQKQFLFGKAINVRHERKRRQKLQETLRGDNKERELFLNPEEQALVLQEQNATTKLNEKALLEDPVTTKGYARIRDLQTDEERTVVYELPPARINSPQRKVQPKKFEFDLQTWKVAVLIICIGLIGINMWHTFFWAKEDYKRATLVFKFIAETQLSTFHSLQLSYKYCILIGFIPFFTGLGGILSFNLFENEHLMVYVSESIAQRKHGSQFLRFVYPQLFLWSPFLAIPLNVYLICNRHIYWTVGLKKLEQILRNSMFVYEITQNRTGNLKNEFHFWNQDPESGEHSEHDFWNGNQYHLKCCGIHSYLDWHDIDWGYWKNKPNKPTNVKEAARVPSSCCTKYNEFIEVGALNRTESYSYAMELCQFHWESKMHRDGCLRKIYANYLELCNSMMWCVMMYNFLTIFACISAYFAYVKFMQQKQPNFKYTFTQCILDFFLIGLWIRRTGKIGPAPVPSSETKSIHEFEHIAFSHIQTSESSYFKDKRTHHHHHHKENEPYSKKPEENQPKSDEKIQAKPKEKIQAKSEEELKSGSGIEVILAPRKSFS